MLKLIIVIASAMLAAGHLLPNSYHPGVAPAPTPTPASVSAHAT